ncbi:ATP-dependent RNA helicase [Pelagivirga sediminicola]|uniref:ATP-dependent RNA helicase n=1 Tax=Pelagivirga sediminicola TaxID=2170575 RepID=A0A2T7G6N5_9RHOB|nr:DEAD/DEAH box helicase [Pelagivirga sediminicola]PVA10047.1 ATP-dependent RNA helicase [Pelagivirga sediminicola]
MKTALADAIAARGYTTLTPVQEAVTNPDLTGADMLVSAQTGSGKTLGFGLAIAPTLLGEAEKFDEAAAPLALVIAPTRELALQVKRELTWLYAGANAVLASCVGGMDMRDERRALARGAHIVVATPGRLRDHIMRGSIDLSALRAVILDEADEMLDLGFREDLEFILGEAPDERQTLLFSATVPAAIAKLAQGFQKDAVRVSTANAEAGQHADIEYRAMNVSPRDGENAIINVLRYYESPNAIVFCNTRAMVARLTTRLSNRGFAVVALSGELTQSERTHALQAMRDGRARVCVATDVAARGIDLPNLDLVVHAELPGSHETLLHRSGRTGRAGRKGVSVLIVPPVARKKAERILNWAKLRAEWGPAPSADEVSAKDEERMMNDEAWAEAITESEAPAIAKLIERFTPEQIAAAYLRQYHSRHSAPEDLGDPGEKPIPRAAFGPSVWFSVSGGRDKGAEPRRLLPMLCKAGGITRDDIGAIRVGDSESYVELRKPAVAGFKASIGENMRVEDGAEVTELSQPPAIAQRPAAKPRPGPKPEWKKPAPKGPPPASQMDDLPAILPQAEQPERKPRAKSTAPVQYDDAPAPRHKKPKADAPNKPHRTGPKPDFTRDGAVSGTAPKPKWKGKPGPSGPGSAPAVGKPSSKKNRARAAAKAAEGYTSKPGKPGAKPAGKPFGKPGAKPGGKPRGAAAKGGSAAPKRSKD